MAGPSGLNLSTVILEEKWFDPSLITTETNSSDFGPVMCPPSQIKSLKEFSGVGQIVRRAKIGGGSKS